MLDIILVAAAMYVCPGDVYTDQPRPGCTPLQESGKEGFSTIPEAPEFNSKPSVSSSGTGTAMKDGSSKVPALMNTSACDARLWWNMRQPHFVQR